MLDKKTLREYRSISAEARELEEQINSQRAKAESPRAPCVGPSAGAGGDHTGELVVRIADMLATLDAKRLDLLRRLEEIEKDIDRLSSRERRIIRLYYIQGMRWEEVCVTINYSWRQTHNLHREALKNLSVM